MPRAPGIWIVGSSAAASETAAQILREKGYKIVQVNTFNDAIITGFKERQREIGRLKQLCVVLRHISHAIIWTAIRNELFQKICRILVDNGGFKLAWIGWH